MLLLDNKQITHSLRFEVTFESYKCLCKNFKINRRVFERDQEHDMGYGYFLLPESFEYHIVFNKELKENGLLLPNDQRDYILAKAQAIPVSDRIYNSFDLQSEDQTAAAESYTKTNAAKETDNTQQNETVTFLDQTAGAKVVYNPIADSSFFSSETTKTELSDFMARPVNIANYTWDQPNLADQTLSPWLLYFQDPKIKRKLDNY